MQQTKTTLEIGDVLYARNYGEYSGPYIIDRVTPTQAFCKSRKFKRALSGETIVELATGKWNTTFFEFNSPEIQAKIKRRNLKYRLSQFNYELLPLVALEEIDAILKKHTA